MKKTAIEIFADFVSQTPSSQHPQQAVERAKAAVLDTLGCILLGINTQVTNIAHRASSCWGQEGSQIIGMDIKHPAPWAALIHGTAAHAFDFDDYTFIANDHPSAVMLPALLAASFNRESEISGLDLLDAYLIGLEVIFRMGEAVNMGHYKLGWHTTSTIDSLGATAAICRLYKFDHHQTAAALSLVTSMGSGNVSQFGTSGKPLHAGLAAKAGLLAANLGGAGATGQLEALDGAVSFATLQVPAGEADFVSALAKLGNPWGIEEHGLGAKVYPSCGYTHRSVDAALAVRAQLGLQEINEIENVVVSLPDFHLAVLPYHVPKDRNEALFSTAYCVATALATGDNCIEDFTHQGLERKDILELTRRIKVFGRQPERPELNFDEQDPDSVEVMLSDGRHACHRVPVYTGAPGRDLKFDEFVMKFENCHRHHLAACPNSSISSDALIDAVNSLPEARNLSKLIMTLG